MKILVTGCAGFIGYNLVKKLLNKKSNKVYGIDNLNKYYDVNLKRNRLKEIKNNKNFIFFKIDIKNKEKIYNNFIKNKYDVIIHLAAQAGVRYSFENPDLYVDSNIIGFNNVLQAAKKIKVKHFIFASSSSVYGNLKIYPYKENFSNLLPESFYGLTKLINENLAYSFSNMYSMPCTAIRFFTVYGPYGRPDMSLFKFISNIKKNKEISLFNHGNHTRDFTYIDDAVNYLYKIFLNIPKSKVPFQIFNIASGKPIKLKDYINIIQEELGLKAKIKLKKIQKGDAHKTHADIKKISSLTKYKPKTDIRKGIVNFLNWYNEYF